MYKTKSFSGRLTVYIATLLALALLGGIIFSTVSLFFNLRKITRKTLEADLDLAADAIVSDYELTYCTVQGMSVAQEFGLFGQREQTVQYLKALLELSPIFFDAYVVYDKNADGQDSSFSGKPHHDDRGGFAVGWVQSVNGPVFRTVYSILTSPAFTLCGANYKMAGVRNVTLSEPHSADGVLQVEMSYPIVISNRFAGVVGIDRRLADMAQTLSSLKKFDSEGFMVLTEKKNVVVCTYRPDSQGFSLKDLPEGRQLKEVLDDTGGAMHWIRDEESGIGYFYVQRYVPECEWRLIIRVADSEMFMHIWPYMLRHAAVSLFSLLFIIVVVNIIVRKATRPVRAATVAAEKVSSGDLTVQIESMRKDDLGVLLNSIQGMTASLNSIVSQVQQIGVQLSASTRQLFSSTRELEQTVSAQSVFSDKVLQRAENIAETAGALAELMQNVGNRAEQARESAEIGTESIEQLQNSILRVQSASRDISGKLQHISEKANAIEGIISTIDAVAHQTNLLSLNAAIEAEKAGEHGRGFSVVAREIQRLADQTGVSSTTIRALIGEMQAAVSGGVMEMERFAREVTAGSRGSEYASRQLAAVAGSVRGLAPDFRSANEKMQIQFADAQAITASVKELADAAKSIEHTMHEFKRVAAILNEQADVLQQEISGFKVN